MKTTSFTVGAALALILAGVPEAHADEKHGKTEDLMHEMPTHGTDVIKKEEHKDEHKSAQKKVVCTEPVHLTEEAERKLGGALYKGPLPKAAKKMAGMKMGATPATGVMGAKKMAEMEGAHGVHKGFRGGEFIMVPNQLHHMEVVYSLECGFQLFTYNAYTEPIRVDRFQAFILILPEGGDEFFEVMRFLVPSADGSVLQTPIAHHHDNPKNPKGLFEVEMYLKFPEDIHPRKFDLVVGTEDN